MLCYFHLVKLDLTRLHRCLVSIFVLSSIMLWNTYTLSYIWDGLSFASLYYSGHTLCNMWWGFRKIYPLSVQAVPKVFVGPFLLTEFCACILHRRFNYFISACLRFGCQISQRYPLDQLWFVFMLVYKCKDDCYTVFWMSAIFFWCISLKRSVDVAPKLYMYLIPYFGR